MDALKISAFHRQRVDREVNELMEKHGLRPDAEVAEFLSKTIIFAHQFGLFPKGEKDKALTPVLDEAISYASLYAESLRKKEADKKTAAKLAGFLRHPGIPILLYKVNCDAYDMADRLESGDLRSRSLARLIRLLAEARLRVSKAKSGRPWKDYGQLIRAAVIAYERCKGTGAALPLVRDVIKLSAAGKAAEKLKEELDDQLLSHAILRVKKERLKRWS